jgi:D,D-heptose 1,7-bisphosphate phosphatase
LARQLIILAGGKGTRLAAELGNVPKSLADIDGRPLLHRQLDLAAEHDFKNVLLLIQHGAQLVRDACGDGASWGIQIDYIEEASARGTAGAVLGAHDQLSEQFMVLYGDTVLDVDLNRMMSWHNAYRPEATLLVHPNDHPFDSDLVEIDQDNRVVAFYSKPHPSGRHLPNLVNAGLYVLERSALLQIPSTSMPVDFGKDVFPAMLAAGADLRGYRNREYIKDAGTPYRLAKVICDLATGRVARRSFKFLAPAVFLDRDGTLNHDGGHISTPESFALLPNADQAIKRLNDSDYLTVVITNQPVVARGEASEETLQQIHNRMETLLGKAGAYVDAIYYCPHHPDRGFSGERPELKVACNCRKPNTGLIGRAQSELGICLDQSWFIGDSTIELETARRAGIRSILVRTGAAGRDGKFPQRPDFICRDLSEAVSLILDVWPEVTDQATGLISELPAGSLVLIGGAVRAGKSTFASALAYVLHQAGRSAVVINIDRWLPSSQTPETSPRLNCDLSAVELLVRNLGRGRILVDSSIHPDLNSLPAPKYQQVIDPGDVVILEGVLALALDAATTPTYRIFFERDEEARRDSLLTDYLDRGLAADNFEQFYRRQLRHTDSFALSCRTNADRIITSSPS